MAVGGLIAGLSGLCTGAFQISFLVHEPGNAKFMDYFQVLLVPIMFGIAPFIIGLALFFGGRRLLRQPKQ